MKKLLFATSLLAFLSVGILEAAVNGPHLVLTDPSVTNGEVSLALAAPDAMPCVEALAELKVASGAQFLPVGVSEWSGGSDRTTYSGCDGQVWKFSLAGKPSGLYQLLLSDIGTQKVWEKVWIILGGYIPPVDPALAGLINLRRLFIGPAEIVSAAPQDTSRTVIYLGKVGAEYGGNLSYVIYQPQDDGLHAWEVGGEMGVYPEATCSSAVTLTLPTKVNDAYQGNRTGFVEIVDNATGESFSQVLMVPDDVLAAFPVVCPAQ